MKLDKILLEQFFHVLPRRLSATGNPPPEREREREREREGERERERERERESPKKRTRGRKMLYLIHCPLEHDVHILLYFLTSKTLTGIFSGPCQSITRRNANRLTRNTALTKTDGLNVDYKKNWHFTRKAGVERISNSLFKSCNVRRL